MLLNNFDSYNSKFGISQANLANVNSFNEESGYIGEHQENKALINTVFINSFNEGFRDQHFQLMDRNQFASAKQDIYQLGILIIEMIISVYVVPLQSENLKKIG